MDTSQLAAISQMKLSGPKQNDLCNNAALPFCNWRECPPSTRWAMILTRAPSNRDISKWVTGWLISINSVGVCDGLADGFQDCRMSNSKNVKGDENSLYKTFYTPLWFPFSGWCCIPWSRITVEFCNMLPVYSWFCKYLSFSFFFLWKAYLDITLK